MYKRRARVLFIDAGDGALARRAVALAARLGPQWVEARGAPRTSADAAALHWADLVVELATGPAASSLEVPAGTRAVVWREVMTAGEGETSLEERVRGMVGGMRLLARGRPPRP